MTTENTGQEFQARADLRPLPIAVLEDPPVYMIGASGFWLERFSHSHRTRKPRVWDDLKCCFLDSTNN